MFLKLSTSSIGLIYALKKILCDIRYFYFNNKYALYKIIV